MARIAFALSPPIPTYPGGAQHPPPHPPYPTEERPPLFTAPLFARGTPVRGLLVPARENGAPLVPPLFVYFRRVNQDLIRRPVPNKCVHACCPSRVQVIHKIESTGAVIHCPYVRDFVFQVPPQHSRLTRVLLRPSVFGFTLISPFLTKTMLLLPACKAAEGMNERG